MMTDRWLNYVLAVVVGVGLVAVAMYNQPRDRQERAEFLDQPLAEAAPTTDAVDAEPAEREPIQLRQREPRSDDGAADASDDDGAGADDGAGGTEPAPDRLDVAGVSASHPLAVEAGMQVLAAGGNAVDAAVAVAYTLGVVEPFGSGIGGGGAMLVMRPDEEPRYYDYREVAPLDGVPPASDIGVPGFVAGMEHVHDEHGRLDLADLIEFAARYAEDGFEVDAYLTERLAEAAHRMPIHLLPRFFPDGVAVPAGTTLRQPGYAEALRLIQADGAAAMYDGELGQRIADAVNGLELDDLRAYEVLELEPSFGTFAGYELVAGGAPIAGPAVIQVLQLAAALDIGSVEPDSADAYHLLAQAWRQANAQRIDAIGDPSIEDVDLSALLDPEVSRELAAAIPADGFVAIDEDEEATSLETDTTHVVVVDREGRMVSMTNTLSNFFGSGLPVSGFFLNDQLKNFSPDPTSINHAAPLKRPRSFIAPTIVVEDGRPVLGIGSPGGRRIPNIVAQVLIRWAAWDQSLEDAVLAPRFHLERRTLEVEEAPSNGVVSDLLGRGYAEVTTFTPTTEYYGAVQALLIDWEAGTIEGVDEVRRQGSWAAG
jgi:gamma-glutamyltranspeptidase / glutathione hydrolase